MRVLWVTPEEYLGGAQDPGLLATVYGYRRSAEAGMAARLDFDEYQQALLSRDEIYLAGSGTEIFCQYLLPAIAQPLRRVLFESVA